MGGGTWEAEGRGAGGVAGVHGDVADCQTVRHVCVFLEDD